MMLNHFSNKIHMVLATIGKLRKAPLQKGDRFVGLFGQLECAQLTCQGVNNYCLICAWQFSGFPPVNQSRFQFQHPNVFPRGQSWPEFKFYLIAIALQKIFAERYLNNVLQHVWLHRIQTFEIAPARLIQRKLPSVLVVSWFYHFVFLLRVDDVADTTLACFGVAFYSRTCSRVPEAEQPSFMRLNECLVIRLRQRLQVHIRHVNGHFRQRECRQLVNERKGKIVAGEAGGNAWCPVVSFDRAGYQYVSIRGEGECCPLVGVTPVVAITSNDKLPESVNQHFVQCFDVFHARLWQVAVFPLLLLELIPALVVGGLVQRFPLIPSLEATNIAMLGGFAQFLFGLRCEVQP